MQGKVLLLNGKTSKAIRRLRSPSAFVQSVSVLVGGTGAAQLVLVLVTPLLTRLYSPDDFGLLAIYGGLLAIITVVSSLRYELAIPLSEYEQEAANLALLCLIILATTSLLVAMLVIFLSGPIAAMLGVPKLADYLWLLPVGLLASGSYNVFQYWGIRTKRFTTIASSKLRQAIAAVAIQVTAFKLGGIALIFGHVLGQGVGTTSLALPALKTPNFKLVSASGVQAAAVRYKHFPIFSTWGGLFNVLGSQVPLLLLATFFSVGAAGLYALANRILAMPANLLGSALSQVFLAHGLDARRERRLGEIYIIMQNRLLQAGLPPTLIIIFLGPWFFEFVFGANWREAGVFSQFLAPAVFMGFVVSPLSQIFIILEKQKAGFFLQLILFANRILGVSIGVFFEDLILAVSLFSFGSALGYLFYIIAGAFYTECSLIKLLMGFIACFLHSIMMAMPVIAAVLIGIDWVIYIALVISSALIFWRYWQILNSKDGI